MIRKNFATNVRILRLFLTSSVHYVRRLGQTSFGKNIFWRFLANYFRQFRANN